MSVEDIEDLLIAADTLLAEVVQIYPETLANKKVGHRLTPKIKSILEHQRSALDYLAAEIHARHGTPTKKKIYYPLAPNGASFAPGIESRMPGVRSKQPQIAKAIEHHQPYQADYDWLKWLKDLTNENKHTQLSPLKPDEGVKVWFNDGTSLTASNKVYQQINLPEAGKQAQEREEVWVDWRFTQPNQPALRTLKAIQAGLKTVVADLRQVAGL
jgi:hypothetical protein